MGEKDFLPFHCYFAKNLSNIPHFPPNFFARLWEAQAIIRRMVSANEVIS
jgi:hypothetical protein